MRRSGIALVLALGVLLSPTFLDRSSRADGPTLRQLLERYGPVNRWVRPGAKADRPWRFLVVGDTQHNFEVHRQVAERMSHETADLLLHTGDLVGSGSRLTHWQQFLEASKTLRAKIPYYPSLGNHERFFQYYLRLFRLPGTHGRYYAFVHKGWQFIALDSNRLYGRRGRAQLSWLAEVLARHPRGRSIAFFHHPPVSTSTRVRMQQTDDQLTPVLARFGVPLIFNGHFHHYERLRWKGIQVVISGGGGGKLRRFGVLRGRPQKLVIAHHYVRVTVERTRLVIEAFAVPGGERIDRFELPVPPIKPRLLVDKRASRPR
ncbi:MAG: metallophosphoesterase [Myxococcales bacterium]|nr:metallophosphoesterase [Myxococcales bacterium]